MEKIFIVEDDIKIRRELCTLLTKYGYSTDSSDDFEHIVGIILISDPQLVCLDINLPYVDGYYICRELRKQSDVPIIVVTSRDSDLDELMSMNLGADDFITKPYNVQILLARITALLKRANPTQHSMKIKHHDLEIDLGRSTICHSDHKIDLTKNELCILRLLVQNANVIVSRDELINALWQSDDFVDDNTLTVNINRLRKKLEAIGIVDLLQTKRGLGYMVV